jgi:hypothetical protein
METPIGEGLWDRAGQILPAGLPMTAAKQQGKRICYPGEP